MKYRLVAVLSGLAAALLIGSVFAHEGSHQEVCVDAENQPCPPVVTNHYVLNTDEGEARWFLGTLATIKASSEQTGGAMALVEFLCPPGFATPLHVHLDADEAFYVLEGTIRGVVGDEEWTATAGSFVWLPRGIAHGFAVVGDQDARILAMVLPSGFDGFVREVGDPAPERVMPPPFEPDVERLLAAAGAYGQEVLGPLQLDE
jgi:quercetin dioxygenase-like cupin family protein